MTAADRQTVRFATLFAAGNSRRFYVSQPQLFAPAGPAWQAAALSSVFWPIACRLKEPDKSARRTDVLFSGYVQLASEVEGVMSGERAACRTTPPGFPQRIEQAMTATTVVLRLEGSCGHCQQSTQEAWYSVPECRQAAEPESTACNAIEGVYLINPYRHGMTSCCPT